MTNLKTIPNKCLRPLTIPNEVNCMRTPNLFRLVWILAKLFADRVFKSFRNSKNEVSTEPDNFNIPFKNAKLLDNFYGTYEKSLPKNKKQNPSFYETKSFPTTIKKCLIRHKVYFLRTHILLNTRKHILYKYYVSEQNTI